jgi:hypothetical protein
MDVENYEHLDGEALLKQIRSLSRSELDQKLNHFGTQYSLLTQRLEALYTPDRLDRFIKIRPGGLEDIDKEIELAGNESPKELALLRSFRELNRVLLPFMDVYEEHALADLKFMSKEEILGINTMVSKELAAASNPELQKSTDYRAVQNAAGMLRLATLMKEAITRELKDRFGQDPE